MEQLEKQNYLSTKYSLDNLKKQKEAILKNKVTFTGFDRINVSKDVMIKEYYDTPDFFLQQRGITVNKNTIKGKKKSELVVRFDTGKERIQFISNIPDTFAIEIGKKESIYSYCDFIAGSISELIPNGISVDLYQLVNGLYKICTVTKQREVNRMISISGLKVNFTFVKALFESNVSKKKESQLILEVESDNSKQLEDYNAFVKKLSFNNPTLIKLKSSDIEIAKDLLFKDLINQEKTTISK